MAQLSDKPVDAADVAEYLSESSDFAFEMQVIRVLARAGVKCMHGGTYTDPVTGLTRQFDIRAVVPETDYRLRLAIECKMLGAHFPLLIHAVRRTETESFHVLLQRHKTSSMGWMAAHRISPTGVYPKNSLVGKKTDQIGRRKTDGRLVSSDGDVFGKISQAINSSYDLVAEAERDQGGRIHAIIPVLVVPDDTLWQVDYDEFGKVTEPGRLVTAATIFINKNWSIGSKHKDYDYDVSHLEVTTIGALTDRFESWFDRKGIFDHDV